MQWWWTWSELTLLLTGLGSWTPLSDGSRRSRRAGGGVVWVYANIQGCSFSLIALAVIVKPAAGTLPHLLPVCRHVSTVPTRYVILYTKYHRCLTARSCTDPGCLQRRSDGIYFIPGHPTGPAALPARNQLGLVPIGSSPHGWLCPRPCCPCCLRVRVVPLPGPSLVGAPGPHSTPITCTICRVPSPCPCDLKNPPSHSRCVRPSPSPSRVYLCS